MTDERRTVLVAHPGAELYGSDRVMVESMAGFVAEGRRVVVALPVDGPLVAVLRAAGAEVRLCPTPVLRKSALRPSGWPGLVKDLVSGTRQGRRLLRSERPEALYVSTITVPWWLVLARLGRVPILAHVHEAEGSASVWMRRALTAPLLLAQEVVANSTFAVEVLRSALSSVGRRAVVIHNAVPGPPSPPQAARAVLDDPVRLVYLGRLSERKGVDVVIDALTELDERGVACTLDVVGAVYPGYEWFEERLRATVERRGLGSRVTFHGFRPDVWSHLTAADIAVVPSRHDEPFGNTAVEAVLAARPAVVSSTTGLLEAAAGYGSTEFVAPGSASALADGVESVVRQWEQRREAAMADSLRAQERHSPAEYHRLLVARLAALPRRRVGTGCRLNP